MGPAAPQEKPRGAIWAGLTLGFALGGFFDGILLHQILQWHHLLSGLEQARADLRFLILTDGLFHLLMYLVAGVGLWLLVKAKHELDRPGVTGRLVSAGLVGFGLWHVADALVSHWLLGIHRIRTDAANPLLWDILWVCAFGLVPLVIGWLIARRRPIGASGPIVPAILACCVVAAGTVAALPPQDAPTTAVLFRPDMTAGQKLSAVRSIDARLIWADPSEQVWVIRVPEGASQWQLYGQGALVVGGTVAALGCLDWLAPA